MSPRNEGLHFVRSPLTDLESHSQSQLASYTSAHQPIQEGRPAIDHRVGASEATTISKTELDDPFASKTAPAKEYFHKHHEARPSELFYDLFFVANLTAFTSKHPVNDSHSLSAYVAFFSVLWFTWLQVTLYDVRFGNDSIAERFFKVVQLGAFVGFSILGPRFRTDYFSEYPYVLISFSFILMGTRIASTLQYLTTFWLSKSQRETRVPVLLLAALSLLGAVAYGVMAGILVVRNSPHAYIAWYAIAVFEIFANIVITRHWQIVSFRGTHLGERMSQLTLIILGEGIIVLMESIEYLVNNPDSDMGTTAGLVTSVVLVYYFFYMLYFDKFTKEYFGLIRQQVWAFLHFPLHVVLVLLIQGVNQMMLLRKISEQNSKWLSIISTEIADLPSLQSNATAYYQAEGHLLQEWLSKINEAFEEASIRPADLKSAYFDLVYLQNFNGTTEYDLGIAMNTVRNLTSLGTTTISDAYGIDGISSADESPISSAAREVEIAQVFLLVFGYLFITAGIALILLAIMSYLTFSYKRKPSRGEWASIGIHCAVGLGLVLISTMLSQRHDLSGSIPTLYKFFVSPWVLPLIVLCYGGVLGVEVIRLMYSSRTKAKAKKQEDVILLRSLSRDGEDSD